jgi:hypothetical protein
MTLTHTQKKLGMDAKEQISRYIDKNNDWKGSVINQIRELIMEIKPDILEEWKWNSPVWSYNGMVCSASAFKKHVSLTFFKGASLPNQSLFNSDGGAKTSRSIIWKDNHEFDREALKNLIEDAIKENLK